MFKRSQMIQVHMLLAALVLPLLLIYFISGILYTLDIKGSIEKQSIKIALDEPFKPDLNFLTPIIKASLIQRQLPIPGGEASLKKKSVYIVRWGDLKYAVKVKETSDPKVLNLVFRERSFLTQVMRIHRADAGLVFKMIPLILLIGMLFVLLSGIYMALTIPKFKRPVLYTMGLSTLLFLIIFMV